jgi:hypothetical protein
MKGELAMKRHHDEERPKGGNLGGVAARKWRARRIVRTETGG